MLFRSGNTALRMRDIVLRDSSGASVAVAPKAEVGISGASLLLASPRAQSFRLVDANMAIQIDPEGRANILVGGERPFATIAPARSAQDPQVQSTAGQNATRSAGSRPAAKAQQQAHSLEG